MSDPALEAIRDLIQQDPGGRGLRTDPGENLVTACAADFAAACRSLAATPGPGVAIVTGFYIPHANPPCGETDGPLGAVFLARALMPLGFRVALVTDAFCKEPLKVGLTACGLQDAVPVLRLPPAEHHWDTFLEFDWQKGFQGWFPLTHLIALERVGPSHTPDSVRAQPGATDEAVRRFLAEVPAEHHDRCHTMRGRDITPFTNPAHRLFEWSAKEARPPVTIGIGDGGNEVGMGKIPWEIIRRNIPGGGLVACRVPTDHLVVCGVSNWGAYGLAAGVALLRGQSLDRETLDPDREREILRVMVKRGPLVDGVSGQPTPTVDGLSWEQYAEPLRALSRFVGPSSRQV